MNRNSFRKSSYPAGESCPLLSKPCIVGYMSVDGAREYRADLSELKYITRIPRGEISFNLDHNADKAVKRTSEDNVEKIDLLLKYLLDQRDRILPLNANFFMYRRTMISVFSSATGIERSCIVATLFNGSIYLCNIVESSRNKKSWTPEQLRFCAWGYKFEQFMNADLPSVEPDIEKPVVENAEFSLYYYATLGSHKLLYGAQIDGMLATPEERVPDPPQTTDYETNLNYLRNKSYVELKTNKEICHWRQEENFKKHKMLKCWAQCYLAGLKGLLVGYRTDQGVVRRLEWFDTEEIVKYCQHVWSPGPALQFLDYFLTFVKNTFKNHVGKTVGPSCNFKEIGPITLQFDIDIDRDRTIRVSETSEQVLPDWFLDAHRRSTEN